MLLTALLLALPAHADPDRAERRAERLATQAEQAFSAGDLNRAYKKAAKALDLDQGNAMALQIRGVVLLVASDDPNQPMAQEMRQEARLMFALCSQADPDGPVGELARNLLAQMDGGSLLEEPSVDCPPEAHAALDRAELAFQQRDFEEATKGYEEALGRCPGAVPWYTWYGDVWFAKQDFERAVTFYEKSLALDPCFWPAHRFIADARAHQGRVDEALDEAARAVACNPSYGFGWSFLQGLAEQSGARAMRVSVDKPAISPTATGVELVLPHGDLQAPGFSGGIGVLYGAAKVSAGEALTPLQRERAAVRSVLTFVRSAAEQLPDEELALWALLAQADAEGFLDEAIFMLLLDEALLPEFLEYREANYDRLVRYVREFLVVSPGAP